MPERAAEAMQALQAPDDTREELIAKATGEWTAANGDMAPPGNTASQAVGDPLGFLTAYYRRVAVEDLMADIECETGRQEYKNDAGQEEVQEHHEAVTGLARAPAALGTHRPVGSVRFALITAIVVHSPILPESDVCRSRVAAARRHYGRLWQISRYPPPDAP